MTIVALIACISFGVGYILKHGLYTQVTKGRVTNVTSDILKHEEKQVTPLEMVTVESPPTTRLDEKYNTTKVSHSHYLCHVSIHFFI